VAGLCTFSEHDIITPLNCIITPLNSEKKPSHTHRSTFGSQASGQGKGSEFVLAQRAQYNHKVVCKVVLLHP